MNDQGEVLKAVLTLHEATEMHFNASDARFERIDARFDTVEGRLAAQETRLDRLERNVRAGFDDVRDGIRAGFEDMRSEFARVNQRLDRLEGRRGRR